MWSPVIKKLIQVAESKGIRFRWVNPKDMDTKMGKNCLGFYNPRLKCVAIRKGLSQKQTEETITHEVAHVLWDLSSKVKRSSLKKINTKTSLPTWLTLLLSYKKEEWEEERFALHMESKPSLVLHLFNQLLIIR